ncbi:MAG: TIGR02646 family protein [Alphaproteobacteria bacterium]|nr:TIGR02646 family protein [Alphaproteobacteria bacterium]
MRRVRKGEEPPCLDNVRWEVVRIEHESRALLQEEGDPAPLENSVLDDRWAEVKDNCKSALRKALVRDQDGLCAYCGGRLKPDALDPNQLMKIEHFVPRAADRDLILDWSNLLGCCPGRYRDLDGQIVEHCDSKRTDYEPGPPPRGLLHTHPVNSPVSPDQLFTVNVTAKGAALGSIIPATPEASADLKELNLNAPRLVENRAEAIRRLRVQLRNAGPRARQLLQRTHTTATTPGPEGLPPYAHVIAAYTARKLQQYNVRA